jgi:7-carboxy-7-deazaguanine synthase
MAQYEWSEVFMSIEGEGPYSGHPTAYIRFAKCNFQCKGFNNPEKRDTTSIEVLGFDPGKYSDIYTIPLITRGCDSIYSWDEKFKHMWHKGDENDIGKELLSVLPHNSFKNPVNGKRVILSLTGGEPTLRLKFIPDLLRSFVFKECKHILIETNCSVPLRSKDMENLFAYSAENGVDITWSNSPKLSLSGEKWEDAIKPEIARDQQAWLLMANIMARSRGTSVHWDQYFKFVCGPNEEDFDEVNRAMEAYYTPDGANVGIDRDVDVYVMPVACTEEQQQDVAAKVAAMCIQRGYIYCHRIQNSVFGNGVGT